MNYLLATLYAICGLSLEAVAQASTPLPHSTAAELKERFFGVSGDKEVSEIMRS